MESAPISKEETTKRIVGTVQPPKWEYISSDKLFTVVNGKKVPNVDVLKQHMKEEGRLNPADALFLIKTAAQIFKKEPNLIQLKDPITGSHFFSAHCVMFFRLLCDVFFTVNSIMINHCQSVVMFMDNILIFSNCSALVVIRKQQNTSFWEIMLTEDILELKSASCSSLTKFFTPPLFT